MARPARSIPATPRSSTPVRGNDWSGEVHGPIADMHRDIEAVFASDGSVLFPATSALSPIDRLLSSVSRAVGWGALSLTVIASVILLQG